jgi:hypothetical protein
MWASALACEFIGSQHLARASKLATAPLQRFSNVRRDMSAFFEINGPQDLLDKAKHDLERLRKEPLNSHAAFDFFVTARHVPDWLGPDFAKAAFEENVELRVCRHLADSGKHRILAFKHHGQVRNTGLGGGAWGLSWGKNWGRSWGLSLYVELDPRDVDTARLGERISVLELAEKVLDVLQRIMPPGDDSASGDSLNHARTP